MKKILILAGLLIGTTFINASVDYKELAKQQKDGNYGTALKMAKQGLDEAIKEEGEKSKGTAVTYNIVGMIQSNMKEYYSAIESFQNALDIFTALPQNADVISSEMITHNNIASAYESIRQFEKAIEHYEKVKKYREDPKSPDYKRLAYVLLNMGHVYRAKGDNKNTDKYYFEALQEAKDLQTKLIILSTMAGFYEETKNYKMAASTYTMIAKIFKDLKNDNPAILEAIKENTEKAKEMQEKLAKAQKEQKGGDKK